MIGIFKKPKGGSPFGELTISNALFDANYPRPQNEMVLVNVAGGVSKANTQRLEQRLTAFADAKIQTQSEFKASFEKPINQLLNLLYVLLALSVVISLFGIVNTLVLTVFERTRELGMLRAVGMTRRQVRRMIRHESIVTALIGGALGMVVGLFLAWLVTQALSGQGFVFAVPWMQLVYFILAPILVGIVAAVIQARTAARLNVLGLFSTSGRYVRGHPWAPLVRHLRPLSGGRECYTLRRPAPAGATVGLIELEARRPLALARISGEELRRLFEFDWTRARGRSSPRETMPVWSRAGSRGTMAFVGTAPGSAEAARA